MRSKTSLGSSCEVAQSCGVSFVNCLYLVPLIIDQNFCTTCATSNQIGPKGWKLPPSAGRVPVESDRWPVEAVPEASGRIDPPPHNLDAKREHKKKRIKAAATGRHSLCNANHAT